MDKYFVLQDSTSDQTTPPFGRLDQGLALFVIKNKQAHPDYDGEKFLLYVLWSRTLRQAHLMKSDNNLRSIAQTIVPAVRRAASTAAPAATQSAKEGFKLVEVRQWLNEHAAIYLPAA